MSGSSGLAAPAFVIAENHVVDPVAYKDYARQVLGTLGPYGGAVILARVWWDSAEYQAIVPLRLKAASSRV